MLNDLKQNKTKIINAETDFTIRITSSLRNWTDIVFFTFRKFKYFDNKARRWH